MFGFLPSMGHFQRGGKVAGIAGTPIVELIPPMLGAYTHLTELAILAGSTAHTIYLMRPLNYTATTAAAAAGQAVVNIAADPGNFTANYQYPLLNSGPNGIKPPTLPAFQTANDLLGAGDYLVFETPDGAFHVDTVASIASLAVTMSNNFGTGGIANGARVWHMGQFGDTDPATNEAQFEYLLTVSSVNTLSALQGGGNSFFDTLHPYDPILFFDANGTATDTLQRLDGFYSKY